MALFSGLKFGILLSFGRTYAIILIYMPSNLATRLQENAEKFPEKPIFILPGRNSAWETITYRQLAERSDHMARGIAALGIQPGTRAVLMAPPSVDFFALVFAMLRAGIVPVMVDPAIGLRNVTACLEAAQPQVYFGSALTQAIRVLYSWGRKSLRMKLGIADVLRAGGSAWGVRRTQLNGTFSGESPSGLTELPQKVWCDALAQPDETEAAIVYTSGSTGLPKGAVFSHTNFSTQIEMLVKALDLRGDEVDLPAFPLFALIDCLLGVTAVIPDIRFPPPAKVDPVKMVNAIQTHLVDTMFVSPAALARVARFGVEKGLKLDSLKKVITAGAPAPAEVQEQFVSLLSPEANLFGVYGSTETLPVSLINSREVLNETRYLSAHGAGICIGRPVDGAQVRIISISDEAIPNWNESLEVPIGTVGEITVKGGAVTESYVGQEQATLLAKIRDVDGKAVHRMGDLGYFDEKGRLWYCGRKSHRVETANGTLFTEPIEGIFNAHPQAYRTALVGVEKAGVTEPVLWVELSPPARDADRNRLKGELLELAKAHEMAHPIKTILFHPAFPTDVRHNSKIIREKLAELAKARLK
jgi:acyl-CoA synthetase (AMP-forming)/AMP-acid ligase II